MCVRETIDIMNINEFLHMPRIFPLNFFSRWNLSTFMSTDNYQAAPGLVYGVYTIGFLDQLEGEPAYKPF